MLAAMIPEKTKASRRGVVAKRWLSVDVLCR